MKLTLRYIRFLRTIPPKFRFRYVQRELEIGIYRLWCILRGREFKYPYFPGKPGATYRVVRQIPGIGFMLFGKRHWILYGVPLEWEKIDGEGNQDT